jgi:hypothetical protein
MQVPFFFSPKLLFYIRLTIQQHGPVERTASSTCSGNGSPSSIVNCQGDHQYLYDGLPNLKRRHFLIRHRWLHRCVFHADRL